MQVNRIFKLKLSYNWKSNQFFFPSHPLLALSNVNKRPQSLPCRNIMKERERDSRFSEGISQTIWSFISITPSPETFDETLKSMLLGHLPKDGHLSLPPLSPNPAGIHGHIASNERKEGTMVSSQRIETQDIVRTAMPWQTLDKYHL